MPLVKTMSWSFFWQGNAIGFCHSSHAGISAHLCLSMYQSTLGVTASDSTRYHHVWSTMVHWLLCCGALGTALIIYPACVYLCWTRLCGGGGRETKAGRILPGCMWEARGSRGTPGFVRTCLCVCARACAHVSERQKWQQYSYANMSYGLTYTDTHTKHLIAKKKSLSRAPLCLMCSTLILPFGDICCCVNYTPPGALINTHTNMCTHQHTNKHKHTMYTT